MDGRKKRLDLVLADRYSMYSRHQLQQLIREGNIVVGGIVVTKPGILVDQKADIVINPESLRYVSRAGLKLEAALDYFEIDVKGRIAIDVGLSTGGFTDCLLQRGIAKVYGVDVGTAQLHSRLLNDTRLVVYEQTDIRNFSPPLIPVDIVVVDVSFISVLKIMDALVALMVPGTLLLVLVKPQFEVGKVVASRSGGIIKDMVLHNQVVKKVCAEIKGYGFESLGTMPSPVLGGDGNQEFLAYFQFKGDLQGAIL